MGRLLHSSLAPSTKKGYKNALRHYKNFHSSFYGGTNLLPITEEQMAQFIVVCKDKGLKPNTITTFISAFSYIHRINSLANPTDSFLIKKLLFGLRKESVSDKRLPFTLAQLKAMICALSAISSLSRQDRRVFKAMFLVAFFGLFRAGEVARSKSAPHNTAQRELVTFHPQNGHPTEAHIQLIWYKHSKGHIAQIPLAKQPNRKFCPVTALYKACLYMPRTGPLFCLSNGRPVSTNIYRSVVKACALTCKLDPCRYTTHSFRIGGATLAYELGFSTEQIKQLGRWKSSAYIKYLRPTPLTRP